MLAIHTHTHTHTRAHTHARTVCAHRLQPLVVVQPVCVCRNFCDTTDSRIVTTCLLLTDKFVELRGGGHGQIGSRYVFKEFKEAVAAARAQKLPDREAFKEWVRKNRGEKNHKQEKCLPICPDLVYNSEGWGGVETLAGFTRVQIAHRRPRRPDRSCCRLAGHPWC